MAAARREAARLGARPGVLTFHPHPARILAPDLCPPSLASRGQKHALIAGQGMESMIELAFTADFARLGGMEFIDALRGALPGGLRGLCAGASWSFGRARSGNMALLQSRASQLDFFPCEVPAVLVDDRIVSSTRIRKAVAAGNLEDASACLGRPFSVAGTVQEGARLGRQLGFPTANISLAGQQLPPDGVYAGSVQIDGTRYAAAVNLGLRPTVSNNGIHRILEAHLLDFSGGLYGREVEVELHRFLRPEQKFSGPGELCNRIAADVQEIRKQLGPAVAPGT